MAACKRGTNMDCFGRYNYFSVLVCNIVSFLFLSSSTTAFVFDFAFCVGITNCKDYWPLSVWLLGGLTSAGLTVDISDINIQGQLTTTVSTSYYTILMTGTVGFGGSSNQFNTYCRSLPYCLFIYQTPMHSTSSYRFHNIHLEHAYNYNSELYSTGFFGFFTQVVPLPDNEATIIFFTSAAWRCWFGTLPCYPLQVNLQRLYSQHQCRQASIPRSWTVRCAGKKYGLLYCFTTGE